MILDDQFWAWMKFVVLLVEPKCEMLYCVDRDNPCSNKSPYIIHTIENITWSYFLFTTFNSPIKKMLRYCFDRETNIIRS